LNKTADLNLWGIHAGKTGDADSLFLKKYCVAVGLSTCPSASDGS
jgi:hypothetical protein